MSIAKLIKEKKFKDELLDYARQHDCWAELWHNALYSQDEDLAWRSLWLLCHLTASQQKKLFKKPKDLIARAESASESYQREAFKICLNLDIDEDDLSAFFDWAEKTWLQIDRKASLRIQALRSMAKVAKIYPDLKHEIITLSDSHYLEPLSPGIRKQAQDLFYELDK